MSGTITLTAKVEGSKKKFQFSDEETSIRLNHQRITDIDLSGIEPIKNLTDLSLRGNRIKHIDLTPLKEHIGLKQLSLKGNNLTEIDLEPLRYCRELEWLSLSHNNLKKIDLYPLSSIQNLRYLYLSSNEVKTIDLFPLHVLHNLTELTLDMSKRITNEKGKYLRTDNYNLIPLLDPLLSCENLEIVDVGYKKTFILNGSSDELSPGIERLFNTGRCRTDPSVDMYSHAIAESGIEKVWSVFQAKIEGSSAQNYWINKLEVFDAFGLESFVGYDGKIDDLLIDSKNLEEAKQNLKRAIVERSIAQIENNGSTLFFDVDEIESDSAENAKFIALLLEKRSSEMQEQLLYSYGDLIDLRPLWCTNYGYELLKVLSCWFFAGPKGLLRIMKRFSDAGYTLLEPAEGSGPEKCERPFSSDLKAHILSMAQSGKDRGAAGLVYKSGIPHVMNYNRFFD